MNTLPTGISRKFSIAPMMDWTDRHYRYLARLISRHALLYTEMITTGAILYGDKERFLDFNAEEHPIGIQLGGSNPRELSDCAKVAQEWGYDEVNLNVGCPSDRVQNNMIGACLMGEKMLVAQCINAMKEAVDIPVTIKHRIGIDNLDSEAFLVDFVGAIAETGISTFIIHARKAILKGLSPKENREIPPLIYDRVYKIKELFPELEIIVNGGIKSMDHIDDHLKFVDGVMVGREAYQRPWVLADIDHLVFNGPELKDSALEIGYRYLAYIEKHYALGLPIWHMVRHSLGLFHGQKGGKVFRRHLSQNAVKKDATPAVFADALNIMASFSSEVA